jgi:hypothetical protein
MTMGEDRLTAALSLAKRGLRVFPLRVKGWKPAHKGWKDEATTDPLQIYEWWSEADYNIGVATGDGIVVIDVDDKPGKNGSASLDAFKLNGATYDTFTVRTPTGGRHLYYRASDVHNSAGRLGPDLDVRSAGGYVVGPGSVLEPGTKNAAGGSYLVERADEFGPLPGAFADKLTAREAPKSVEPVARQDQSALDRAEQWLKTAAPLAIEGQGGDHTTYTVACRLKDFAISEDEAFLLLADAWNDRCSPPWPLEDLQTKVTNAYAYGKNPPGIDHPSHIFEGVHVEPPVTPGRQWFYEGDDFKGSVEWLYKGLLPTTGVCILTAPSQAGKTFVGLHLAKSLDGAEDFFGLRPRLTGGTILLVGEAYGSVKHRLAALEAPGRRRAIAATYVGGLAARGAWAALRDDLLAQRDRMAAKFGKPVRMIVLDTLSASGILEDEDDNAAAATVMRAFSDLSVELGALFVILHHPPKSGNGARGAGAITNNADYVMEINRAGFAPIRTISMIKSRDGEQKDIGSFTLIPNQIGLDNDGEAITTMTVSTSNEAPRSTPMQRDALKMTKLAETVCTAVAHATVENPVIRDGRRWVEEAVAKVKFKELTPLMASGNRSRDWARSLSQGVVDIIVEDDMKLLSEKEYA